jgi:FtsP/CotA-like multicopper oxidase with cupredoxin domain
VRPRAAGSVSLCCCGPPLPLTPPDAASGPAEQALENFLSQYITPAQALPFPFPHREANVTDLNPWQTTIEACLGRPLDNPPAEGQPPGENWAHQRYQEFFPKVFFNTAQAGSRTNQGLRDAFQFHGYSVGEFGPPLPGSEGETGLYHNTVGTPGFAATTKGTPVRFHPNFPLQDPSALWTFDGTFPPRLLQARYGEPIMMRHYNALMIDPAANLGFGLHTITTYEHNGHTPAESDGYTQSFFFPGQFYDYHWPMVLAGHDSINTGAIDRRAGAPDGSGGINNVRGDWRELMSTHWFHDHMLDFTAPNIYKGNAAMMNYYSSVDRGNEAIDDGANLRLPSGTAPDWGNRDYDVNLMVSDKAWDSAGQLFFNIFNLDGFVGDQLLTNWLWKPYLDVRARRYRFRILNGSVSRHFRIALVEQVRGQGGEFNGPEGSSVSYNRVPFHMIANDGNIMEHPVSFDGNKTVGGLLNRKGELPTLGVSERYDIIVDFAQFAPGTVLYLVNLLEHRNGKRPHEPIPLPEIINGEYHDRKNAHWTLADQPIPLASGFDSDPCVAKFLEFRVQPYAGQDLSMDPADFVEGNWLGPNGTDQTMIPLPGFTQEELDNALHRTFDFARSSGTDSAPWTIKTDGGAGFNMDPRRLSASVSPNRVEVWHLTNEDFPQPGGGGGWSHPIHIHFEEGQILARGGVAPPEWEKWARKDVYRIGRMPDSTNTVVVTLRFREFLGTFMEHCHNMQHEDHAMLLRWDVENPGQFRVLPDADADVGQCRLRRHLCPAYGPYRRHAARCGRRCRQ